MWRSHQMGRRARANLLPPRAIWIERRLSFSVRSHEFDSTYAAHVYYWAGSVHETTSVASPNCWCLSQELLSATARWTF